MRFKLLGLQSLEYRRTLLNAMYIRDLICSHILCDKLRISIDSLVEPYHRVNYGINEPITRSIILYNNLKDMVNFYNYSKISFKHEYLNKFPY